MVKYCKLFCYIFLFLRLSKSDELLSKQANWRKQSFNFKNKLKVEMEQFLESLQEKNKQLKEENEKYVKELEIASETITKKAEEVDQVS